MSKGPDRSVEIAVRATSLVSFVGGVALAVYAGGWLVALAIVLMMWGDNLSRWRPRL